MYEIARREDLVPNVHRFDILAPRVAQKARAGQFVMVRIDEMGERIPLTIADYDREAGTVTVVFMEVGKTTRQLAALKAGDSLATFVGPLGNPTHIEQFGTVVCVGGGFGSATTFPVARALHEAGNHVITIAGWRKKDLIFWLDRLESASDELIVTTDDGSFGRKAIVTEPLTELLASGRKIDLVVAIGPSIMMKFVSKATEPFKVKTVVSLNPIMVDGTGMCGGCRVAIDGASKFVCVDGPEFDGHSVDWDLLLRRQKQYVNEERQALERYEAACRAQVATSEVA